MRRRKAMTIAVPLAVLFLAAVRPGKPASAADEINNERKMPKNALLYEFANITDVAALPEGLAKQTCSAYTRSADSNSGQKSNALTQDEAAQLSQAMTEELTKRLSKQMTVSVAKPGDVPPEGSLAIAGCFVSADRGNAAARLVGMGLGASHLSAHVRLFNGSASNLNLIDEFDVSVKGSNKLPPAGPVGVGINAARERKTTLQANARKMAGDILKRLENDQKGDK